MTAGFVTENFDPIDGSEDAVWAVHIQNMRHVGKDGNVFVYTHGDYTIGISGNFTSGDDPSDYSEDTVVTAVSMLDGIHGLGFSMVGLTTTFGAVLSSSSPFDLVDPDEGITYNGSELGDTFHGTKNDDLFAGEGGSDLIVLTGTSNDYSVYYDPNTPFGTYTTITDLRAGSPDGFDSALRVEAIQFSNGIKYLDGSKPDTLNLAPEQLSLSSASVQENQPANTEVGVFSAIDPEGKQLLYSLTDDANGKFVLVGDKLVATSSFDRETEASYSVTLTAIDDIGLKTSKTFKIEVGNVNEAPVVSGALSNQKVSEGQVFSFQVPASAFTDVDDATLTYSATKESGGELPAWLHFDADTQTFSGTPGPHDADTTNVKITAADKSGAEAYQTFTLDVIDINHAPQTINDTGSMGEHGTGVFDVLANDTDIDGTDLRVTGAEVKSGDGTISINADGSLNVVHRA